MKLSLGKPGKHPSRWQRWGQQLQKHRLRLHQHRLQLQKQWKRRWQLWFGARQKALKKGFKAQFGPLFGPPADPRHLLGQRGEKAALRHLRRNGIKILYRNYRPTHGGEIDIVCRERDVLVFTEVKTRTDETFGTPAESVTREKQRLIARGAQSWLRLLGQPNIAYRFDIVEVLIRPPGDKPECHLIRDAFPLPEIYRD